MANKRRPQGDGTIRKRPDGRWEGRIIIGHKRDGTPMYKSVFGKTQKATLKMLHQMIDTYRDVDLTEDSRMTLGEWLDKWLDEYMIFTVRESTLDGYRCMTNNQVKRFIGDKQLSSLTTADIQKFYNKIKKQGRVKPNRDGSYELADSMVRGIHMMLHEALDTAVKERLIAKNPTNGTTIPKNNYAEKQILGDEQLTRFLEEIKGEEYWYDFFYLEVMTGLRRGEICGLKWSDIDFGANKLRVQRSVSSKKGGGVNIGETKTNTGTRNIIMPPSVMDALRKRKQTAISAWVFPAFLNPEQPIHPEAAYRKLKVILKHAGLPQIRFHDLRHTFATHAMKGGVDAKTLSGILGHTNASFTLDTYTHVTSDMQKNASVVIGNIMKNIMIKE
jgi:integrase